MQFNTTQPDKKNENLPVIATWMDLEGIMLSEISHTEKDKYWATSLAVQWLGLCASIAGGRDSIPGCMLCAKSKDAPPEAHGAPTVDPAD